MHTHPIVKRHAVCMGRMTARADTEVDPEWSVFSITLVQSGADARIKIRGGFSEAILLAHQGITIVTRPGHPGVFLLSCPRIRKSGDLLLTEPLATLPENYKVNWLDPGEPPDMLDPTPSEREGWAFCFVAALQEAVRGYSSWLAWAAQVGLDLDRLDAAVVGMYRYGEEVSPPPSGPPVD